MIILEFFGSHFIWHRKRRNRLVSKLLDKSVGDHRIKFLETRMMEHYVKRHYEHNSLLLRCNHVSSNSLAFNKDVVSNTFTRKWKLEVVFKGFNGSLRE